MSKPYKPGARSLRRYCTPQKRPATEATTGRGRSPKLPATEAEALHGLSRCLAQQCSAWASIMAFNSGADYQAARNWQAAAKQEREVVDARLNALTDGR